MSKIMSERRKAWWAAKTPEQKAEHAAKSRAGGAEGMKRWAADTERANIQAREVRRRARERRAEIEGYRLGEQS